MLLGNHRVAPATLEPSNNKRFKTDEIKDTVGTEEALYEIAPV